MDGTGRRHTRIVLFGLCGLSAGAASTEGECGMEDACRCTEIVDSEQERGINQRLSYNSSSNIKLTTHAMAESKANKIKGCEPCSS